MATAITFNDACNIIKEKHKQDPKLIEAVDKLLGISMILSPVVFGPVGAPALALLGVKNEVVKIGKSVYEKLTGKKEEDSLARYERMGAAYCLICYTAFFDSADALLDSIRKDISVGGAKKLDFSNALTTKATGKNDLDQGDQACESATTMSYPIQMPHPADDYDEQCGQLETLYEELSKGVAKFVESTSAWENADDKSRKKVGEKIKKLAESAKSRFKAQYFDLAAKFEEFYVWANLHEHEKTKRRVSQLSDFIRENAALAKSGEKAIDVGLAHLAKAVKALPGVIDQKRAEHVIDGLGKAYAHAIDQPIIEDKFVPAEDRPPLSFPKKSKIFIPQSFQVLRHTSADQHLENEATWKGLKSRDTLGSFLYRYLNSPYSLEGPLIILGHPGSGKSLLTEILAARLVSPHVNPIRVELRDIDAESEIDTQIESQIKSDTGRDIEWATLSDKLTEPPLVILDGYDELLQASGKVFRNYLIKVRNFQRRESVQGRPVRVIVTSRITLIDKAEIPEGTTIIRLEEFDASKRSKWIDIWNSTNSHYFSNGVKEFALPEDKKIVPLAAQPLLLLMLALYDSDGNQLRKSKGLDQTLLYNSLLARFVERERLKGDEGKKFKTRSKPERDAEIDSDMHRLGVAAMGMFNRRTLHILTDQLNEDLQFFKLERSVKDVAETAMTQADLLLGSFFFVHESKSKRSAGDPEPHEVAAAFEFLHNTFGEFLTADFVLRAVFSETQNLEDHQINERLKAQMTQRLEGAEAFPPAWYGCLMFTPLYSRPVILEMLREWFDHSLKLANRDKKEFLKHFDTVVSNQIKRILLQNTLPSVMRREEQTPFGSMALLGHMAIYSLNVMLLRTVLDPDGYEFDEDAIDPHEDGARPWDQLANLWRSWFSLDSLRGLTAIWTATRNGSKIMLTAKQRFGVPSSSDRLESVLNVSLALGDNITAGLAGLSTFDPFRDNQISLDEIGKRLATEDIDLRFDLLLRKLRSSMQWRTNYRERRELFDEAFHLFLERRASIDRLIDLLSLAIQFDDSRFVVRYFDEVMHRSRERQIFREAEFMLPFLRLARKAGIEQWHYRMGDDFLDHVLSRVDLGGLGGDALVECVRLARTRPRSKTTIRFAEHLFRQPPHIPFAIDELAPDGLAEIVRFAAEMGATDWFEYVSREIVHMFRPDHDRYVAPKVLAEFGTLAYELGHEEWFDHFFREIMERMLPHARRDLEPRGRRYAFELLIELKSFRNTPWYCQIVALVVREFGPNILDEVPPDVAIELLRASDGELGRRWLKSVPLEQLEGWIDRPVRRLQEKALLTLELSQLMGDFELFQRRFRVDSIDLDGRGDRLRIKLVEPHGIITLILPTLPMSSINQIRWMLGELDRRDLLEEIDRRLLS